MLAFLFFQDTDVFVIQMLNAVGDMIDIRHVVSPSGPPDFFKFSRKELRQYMLTNSHCSVLVKVCSLRLFPNDRSFFSKS